MKNLKRIFLQCTLYFLLCTSLSYTQGTWTQKANVFTTPRAGAVGFSIGNKGYIGTGWQFGNNLFYNDFWEWDQTTSAWTQKANFTGPPRGDAVGFSIGNKGYIVTGYTAGGYAGNILRQWNQATNTWTQKAQFPGATLGFGSAFSIGLKGYVCCGTNGNGPNELWEYDQLTDTWSQKANIPAGRDVCVAFSIGTLCYVCTGFYASYLNDLWEYNPVLNTWTQKANFPGGNRGYASGFSIGNKGYMGTGWNGNVAFSDFWCFDPALNLWTQKADYPHAVTDIDQAGFSIGCKGYFGTGATTPVAGSATFYNDFWEYDPDTCSLTGIEIPNFQNLEFLISPNPFSEKLNISINSHELSEIILYDMSSKKVFYKKFTNAVSIDTKSFAKGIYIYEVSNKNGYLKKGKIFKD